MRRDRNTEQDIDLSGRIAALEHFTGTLVARPQADAPEAEVIPINEPPTALVPRPRPSRVFLRRAEGHGAFADFTLTAPAPRMAD